MADETIEDPLLHGRRSLAGSHLRRARQESTGNRERSGVTQRTRQDFAPAGSGARRRGYTVGDEAVRAGMPHRGLI